MKPDSASSSKNLFRNIPWPRIVAEGAIIVVSILLAFWIDAWWENRSDSQQEQAFLRALVEDFRSARDEFTLTTYGHNTVFSSMEKVLYWTEAGYVSDEEKPTVDTYLSNVFWREVYEPPMGAVDTVLASGRLDFLDNPALVTELTRWKSLVADLNTLEREARDHFYDAIYPYLTERINIQDLDKDIPYPGGVPWPQQPANSHELIPDRQFHNLVYVHWVIHWNISDKVPLVEEALSRIEQLTSAEFENSPVPETRGQ